MADGLGIGAFFGGMGSWFSTVFIWAVLFLIVTGLIIGFFIWRRNSKFMYPTYIVTRIGAGKVGIEKTKAGWFKSQRSFFGLWEVGGVDELITKDKRKIQAGSSIDFHEIGHVRGLICRRKDDDPRILVPITTLNIENDHLLGEIAPADFREAGVSLMKKAEQETLTWLERYQTLIATCIIIMGGLLAIIFIIQFCGKQLEEIRALTSQLTLQLIENAKVMTNAP